MKAHWKAWQSKDGSVQRIYVAKDKFLYEGATGLCCQSGNFSPDEIALAYKIIGEKTFGELFEQVKTQNQVSAKNSKSIAILKKEKKEKLDAAKSDEERSAIILEYAKLMKAAKYA